MKPSIDTPWINHSEKKENFSESFSRISKVVGLSVMMILSQSSNIHSLSDRKQSPQSSLKNTQWQDEEYKNFKYNLTEYVDGFFIALKEKLNDLGVDNPEYLQSLQKKEQRIVEWFLPSIERNWLGLQFEFNPRVVKNIQPIQSDLVELLQLRYSDDTSTYFNWKIHLWVSFEISFLEEDQWYKLQRVSILTHHMNNE